MNLMTTPPPPVLEKDLLASERIKARLEAAGERYFANDNISKFVEEGELQELQDEVAEQLRDVLSSLVINIDEDHNSQDTARRVAKMFVQEVFHGRYVDAPSLTEFPNISAIDELMIIGPIKVRSACSHHLCPIIGKIWIGVLPNADSSLIGLSKYARLVEWVMSRPQIQEEAVMDLADELEHRIEPNGLAIVMEADHFCMHWRGVKDDGSKMVSSVMRGAFRNDASLRKEFLALRS
ncbi:MAG: GTP cyclohydrolase I [Pseudomonadota bacterium]